MSRPTPAADRLPHGARIVFEDGDLVVVDKPPGLLTIATGTERRRTLHALLRERLGARRPPERLFVVHRLDREASGLLVFAKSPEAKRALQQQFARRAAGRTYVALVEGRVGPAEQTFRSLLAENAAHRVYTTQDRSRGKLAVSHARVLERHARGTLVEVRLETGRKHQIRVHLAEAGHPIEGDGRYGSAPRSSRRMALHAVQLRLRHPRTGRELTFRSSPPFARGRPPREVSARPGRQPAAPSRRR